MRTQGYIRVVGDKQCSQESAGVKGELEGFL
jgi:hypothetical protein